MRCSVFRAGNNHAAQRGDVPDQRLKRGQQRLGHDQALGARVAQHEVEVGRGQQGVGRHRHYTGQDATQKSHRPFRGVQHGQQHTALGGEALGPQRISKAVGLIGEFAVGQRGTADGIDKGELVGAAGMALQQVMGGVVVAGNVNARGAYRMVGAAQVHGVSRCSRFYSCLRPLLLGWRLFY